ncbi:Vitamin K epoxide reductase [Methylacidimicrobium cyclopophantes]|uniref:Vitamin K epoxide reductase n=1 Tax=Methylacidimicrobium cyclopophantes TaxID=1041766 RepID=A0A5E6MBZ4_9BACT|nr:vitamin K epoxide reductase family protein [Methylacidimicrobium cyclopophantes]VVM06758.1 Vitamin K epoxide reductase [Methylacidimicrobium cyclopophantes]
MAIRKEAGAGSSAEEGDRGVSILRLLFTGGCFVGMGLTAYLTGLHWWGKLPAGCSADGGCGAVLTSAWSKLFGQPVSLYGFGLYTALAALSSLGWTPFRRGLALSLLLFGVLWSILFVYVSLFVLEATCPYCLTSAGLLSFLFLLLLFWPGAKPDRRFWLGLLPAVLAVGGGSAALFHFSALRGEQAARAALIAKQEGEELRWLEELAKHLDKKGVKFYGATWCNHCRLQRALFGQAASLLPFIDCAPGGRGTPLIAPCREIGVRTFPTWTIGNRRYEGILTPETLAELTGFRPRPGNGGNPAIGP